LIRAGCGGATSLDWLPDAAVHGCSRRVSETPRNLYDAYVAPALPVEIAVIALGTNDFLGQGQPRVGLEEYDAALRELVARLRAGGAEHVVLVKPPPVYHRHPVFQRLLRVNARLDRTCAELEGVACGPDLMRLLARVDFEPGNLHPNASGHAKIAAALAAQLRGLVADP
jgi:lysophospholipase L1-like esterase